MVYEHVEGVEIGKASSLGAKAEVILLPIALAEDTMNKGAHCIESAARDEHAEADTGWYLHCSSAVEPRRYTVQLAGGYTFRQAVFLEYHWIAA